jgi:uncharacterized protein YbjT (DUF2867 family)
MSNVVVVFGSSGKTGGAAVKTLSELKSTSAPNITIRAVARSTSKIADLAPKAELAAADLNDATQVTAALSGAHSVFILVPPRFDGYDVNVSATEIAKAFKQAVHANPSIRRIVVLSSIGAELLEGSGIISTLHTLEQALLGIVPELIFIRAGFFVENWANSAGPALKEPYTLFSAINADKHIPQVATVDIGKTIAKYLTIPSAELPAPQYHGAIVVELSGPKEASATDVAAAFAAASSHAVAASTVPGEALEAVFSKVLPGSILPGYIEMVKGFNADRIVFSKENLYVKERGTTPLETVIAEIVKTAQ